MYAKKRDQLRKQQKTNPNLNPSQTKSSLLNISNNQGLESHLKGEDMEEQLSEILHSPYFALITDNQISDKIKLRAFEVGVDCVLRKPFQAQDLFKLINRHGGHSSGEY